MENSKKVEINREIEENIMAILDTTGIKDSKDDEDDRLAFLEAVRAASIIPEIGTPPTNKMLEAVFQILKNGKSLELIMTSYQLLTELRKLFPQVYISNVDGSKSSSSTPPELVVVKEAWSPFILGSDIASSGDVQLDSSGFHLLIQGLAELADNTDSKAINVNFLQKMFLLQYIVNVLEEDFLPRNNIFKETLNWTLLRESLLNMLLSSRRMSYKGLIKDCLSIFSTLYHFHAELSHDVKTSEESAAKSFKSCDTAVSVSLLEVEKTTCIAVQRLLIMIMELDLSKKTADMQGSTTRGDGVRTPVVEIILDELTYNKDILSPFLQIFDEPRWKLEIVLQYFWKYTAKPAGRTRRSNGSTDDATLNGVLKYYSNSTSTRSTIKKISIEVSQILLAHAFQAYLSLSSQNYPDGGIADSKDVGGGSSLVDLCKSIISAFHNLKRADEHAEMLPLGKETLFTAATILTTKS